MMRIFSGIQPTGELHIGNYLGAIKQWIKLQEKNECLFCIVDLHALTSPFDPKKMEDLVMEKAMIYLAAGVNPKKSIIFIQSRVSQHSELAWLLNTVTPIGDLQRMTQYKEKSEKFKKNINAGLLNYPILMASDILLYQTEIVPVGVDQRQHVELTRTIGKRFNSRFGETFKIPEVYLPKAGAKIMSLSIPTKKMSKSDPPETRIGIFDSIKEIEEKIMRATTDSEREVKYNPVEKPGISNLLEIYSLFSNIPIEKLNFNSYKDLKTNLSKLLALSLSPFREKKKKLKIKEIREILSRGEKKARVIAEKTIMKAKRNMGLI
ncbi:MAG: tryptophan--tRNA ligase [Candidatus Pacebacteria bacterium]|nr:tryptophan--tRNA ligase [Candidatus Paceibacterota bacterium]MDD3072662.1 tryptophan--tRNA ligase [Candidatus Paceibacterota bacterium]MDD3729075.1 tryptophan--tRNA ligase [Candidatus Paceibacterota bacterium]MDD4201777.1 tryptophan--tRNA ligase [Candidatus Paceibacterota bacterium]MDD4467258.1 tryptophan--tRNA ligase [Candidatus Paceibacterota bacterium]